MIDVVTEVLRELDLVEGSRRPRYNVIITKGTSYVVEAYSEHSRFYHVKATEIDPENVRSCFEAAVRARRVFGDVVPEPIACLHKDKWEVFVSQGVHFDALGRDQLLSPGGRPFKGVIEFLSRATRAATVPPIVPHSRFLTKDVLERIGRTDLEAVTRPWLCSGLLEEMDRLPHVRQHGDLVIINVGLRRDGIVVFDWEDFGRLTLPGVDALTLLLSATDFDGRRLRSLMRSSPAAGGECEPFLRSACEALSLDAGLFRRLVPLYLLEFLYLKYDYGTRIQETITGVIKDVCH